MVNYPKLQADARKIIRHFGTTVTVTNPTGGSASVLGVKTGPSQNRVDGEPSSYVMASQFTAYIESANFTPEAGGTIQFPDFLYNIATVDAINPNGVASNIVVYKMTVGI